jgi:chorismate-pyruvate lyase
MTGIRSAQLSLTGLYKIFGHPASEIPRAEAVEPDQMPEPSRYLLVHDDHMTVTMEKFHGTRVKLVVVASVHKGEEYARKILLTHGETGRAVQYGLMRINFKHTTERVRQRILDGNTPLGHILIENNVLHRVGSHTFLRISPNKEMRECFGRTEAEFVYGRLAKIYSKAQPAVDLLEVVAPDR